MDALCAPVRAIGPFQLFGNESTQMASTTRQWEEFFNPDTVRLKLISAGLFLVAHEMLVQSIKGHLIEFFANKWTADGPEPSAKYKMEVLARDPKEKQDPLRGSISWLRLNGVITVADEASIRSVTDVRNQIAHETVAMVSGAKTLELADHFATLMALIDKIEKWWIVNVEVATDPEYAGLDVDLNEIISGPSMVMHLLSQIALGDAEEAWEFHRELNSLKN